MNSYLDKGMFLVVLFSIYYLFLNGQPPTYNILFGGAAGMIVVGLIIEAIKNNRT